MEFGPQAITLTIAENQFQIRYYGIIIVAAILFAATVAARLARRDRRDPEHVWGAMFWAVILGIILARLWFVLFPPVSLTLGCSDADPATLCQDTAWYLQNFFNTTNGAIAIWSGGLSIFGAFIGGFIGSYVYLRRNRLPILPWLDIAAVSLPLGQAIGRIANAVNQELYGTPTTLPWGIQIGSEFRVPPYTSTIDYPAETLFHPLFAYEALWSFAAFILLLNLWQKRRGSLRPGTIFLLYVAQYAFIRFMLEFLRVEVTLVAGVNIAQVVTGIAFVVAVALLLTRQRRPVTPEERESFRDPEPARPAKA